MCMAEADRLTVVHVLLRRWISRNVSNDLSLQCKAHLFVKVACYYWSGEIWEETMSHTNSSSVIRNVSRILVGKPLGTCPFERLRRRNYSIKVDDMEVWCSLVLYVPFLDQYWFLCMVSVLPCFLTVRRHQTWGFSLPALKHTKGRHAKKDDNFQQFYCNLKPYYVLLLQIFVIIYWSETFVIYIMYVW
jgi:hypothetical protein